MSPKKNKWICENKKCFAPFSKEINQEKIFFQTINKQNPEIEFITAKIKCKNCGLVQLIKSGLSKTFELGELQLFGLEQLEMDAYQEESVSKSWKI